MRLCRLARTAQAPAQRAAALAMLAERFRLLGPEQAAGRCGTDMMPPSDELLSVTLGRLTDAPPIAAAALLALRALLSSRPGACAQHLDSILAALLPRSGGQLAGDCEDARSCLSVLIEGQVPSAFMASLRSFLVCDRMGEPASGDHVVRLSALELLENQASASQQICDHLAGRDRSSGFSGAGANDAPEQPMRALVEDLLRDCGSWPAGPGPGGQLRRATARALHALFLRETHAFLSAARALQPAPREALCALLAHFVPELPETLTRLGPGAPEARVRGHGGAAGASRGGSGVVSTHRNAQAAGAAGVAGSASAARPSAPVRQHSLATAGAEVRGGSRSSAKAATVAAVPVRSGAAPPMGGASGAVAAATAMLAGDPEADVTGFSTVPSWSQIASKPAISTLLLHCSPGTQRGTLRSLAVAARTEGPAEWEKHFGRVLILVLDSLAQRDPQGVRDAALLCLQELVVHQAGFFDDFAEVVASKLFEAYQSCSEGEKQAAAAIDRTLERLIGVIEPSRGLELLLPVISSEGVPLLQAATRLLSLVLQRMPPQRVLEQLDVVLPGVVAAFGNPNPEVRKAAVFCLVDIYMILGEQVMAHLVKDLTPSQMKLVTIYIGRQQREREELEPMEGLGACM